MTAYSLLLSLSRMIKRTSPHSLSVLMMRWDELQLPFCCFSINPDWGCFCCFSAGAGDCQQGSAPEAVGLEAGEVHSVVEGHPQCACGQHDLWLHLHPAGYRSDINQISDAMSDSKQQFWCQAFLNNTAECHTLIWIVVFDNFTQHYPCEKGYFRKLYKE